MRYSEARRILEKNGMELGENGYGTYAYIMCGDQIAENFSEDVGYNWHNEYINNYQRAIAQEVAYKLSRTKPEDRLDEPKKYYLKIFNRNDGEGYLNLHKCDNHFTLNNKSDTNIFKTQFTDDEIKQMQQDPTFANIDLEKCKEPVEDK